MRIVDKCPHCEAEEQPTSNRAGGMPHDGWICGTRRFLPENIRSTLCLVREDWNKVRTELSHEREARQKAEAELEEIKETHLLDDEDDTFEIEVLNDDKWRAWTGIHYPSCEAANSEIENNHDYFCRYKAVKVVRNRKVTVDYYTLKPRKTELCKER